MNIFVSVASYNDPELMPTVLDAYNKAVQPDRLRFGILDQCRDDRYDDLPAWKSQIRYLWMKDRDARGVGFARSVIQGMMENEEFLLQIDSHTRFDSGWDQVMISQMSELPWKSILTASPMPWLPDEGNKMMPEGKTIHLYEHPKYPLRNQSKIVGLAPGYGHRLGDRLAAGCFFSRGCLYDHVPYDPHIYFNGEEYLYAQRVMSAGWRIYHPRLLPIYHLYKKTGNISPHLLHWGKTVDRYWDPASLRSKGELRIAQASSGSAGCFSISSSSHSVLKEDPNHLRPAFVDASAASARELKDLHDLLLPLLIGGHQKVLGGSYSRLTHRIRYDGQEYFLKSSTEKDSNERLVDSLLLSKAICIRGKAYCACTPLYCISLPNRYYTIQPFVRHVGLRGKSYRDICSRAGIAYSIGEMNGANPIYSGLKRLSLKKFGLTLSVDRLRRRFPDGPLGEYEAYVERASAVMCQVGAYLEHPDNASGRVLFSLSHNDLHRQNMGLLPRNGSFRPVVFFDWAKACCAPIGNDLQFIVHYLIQGDADPETWFTIYESYLHGLAAGGGIENVAATDVIQGSMLAYVDKWINIHRRPQADGDWLLFTRALDVAEAYLSIDLNQGLSAIVADLVKIVRSTKTD